MKTLLKFAYLVNDFNEIEESIIHFQRKRNPSAYFNDIEALQVERTQCIYKIKGARVVLQTLFTTQTLDYIEEHAKTLITAYTHKKTGE